MEYPFRRALRLALCIFAFIAACQAEKGYVVIQVDDIHNQPIAGIELAAKGSSESGITDRFGRTRIKLDSQAKVNDWIAIQIIRSPAGKDLVLISPWDAHTQIPPFENETVNLVSLVVASRGDRALLENGRALTAIVSQINQATSPRSKDLNPEHEHRVALEATANSFGLPSSDVDKAIRGRVSDTKDPYEKGLSALYEKHYPLASQELALSLQVREKELARCQSNADATHYSPQSKKDLASAESAVADAARFLGQSRHEEGKYRESANAYQRTLSFKPDDTTVINGLGLNVRATGNYVAAEALFRRALAIDERALGPDHPGVATDLANLGELLCEKGDRVSAEPLFRRALTIDTRALAPGSPDLARDLNDLAIVLRGKKDYAGAETLYKRALAICENALGPNDPKVGTVLHNLGVMLSAQGDYWSAEPFLRRALAIGEKVNGPDHPEIAEGLNNLAVDLYNKGDYAEAEQLLRRAIRITEKSRGPNHPATRRYRNNLAAVLKKERTLAHNR